MSQQWGTLTLASGLCTPDHTPSSGQLWEVNSAIIPVFFLIRKWQPTPVLLPRKSHGWRSLVGYSLWGRKELDTTE